MASLATRTLKGLLVLIPLALGAALLVAACRAGP